MRIHWRFLGTVRTRSREAVKIFTLLPRETAFAPFPRLILRYVAVYELAPPVFPEPDDILHGVSRLPIC